MKRILGMLLLLISSCVFAVPAAYVHALDGEARATTSGVSRVLRIGSLLEQGDEVNVSKGTTTLKFEDGQIVGLQQGSQFRIVNYQYNKTRVADSSVVLSLLKGGMRYITGVIGGTRRDAIRLQAGTATIGIRGTDIITFVDANGNVLATVQEGGINFSSAGVTATLNPGQGATAPANRAPGTGAPVTQLPVGTINAVTPLGLLITPGNNPINVTASADLVKAVAVVADAAKALKAAEATGTEREIVAARKAVEDAVAAAVITARVETLATQQAKITAVQGGAPPEAGTSGATQGQGLGVPAASTLDPAVQLTVTVEGSDSTLQTTITPATCTGGVSGC